MVQRHLPGLDGLRAASIVLVLLAHGLGVNGAPKTPTWWWRLGDIGNLGVRIFFVISGFLITYLLLQEEKKTGRISLRGFYTRRAFRILPALYTFLFAILALRSIAFVSFPTLLWFYGATFTMNYAPYMANAWIVGHLWSLAIEEQFYLLWPVILVFAPHRRRLQILTAAIVTAPLCRLFFMIWAVIHGQPVRPPTPGFFTVMDALATGCLFAFLRFEARLPTLYLRMTQSPLTIVLPFMLMWLSGRNQNPWIYLLVVLPLMNFTAATLVDTASRNALYGWQHLLDAGVVRWLGTLSYSLYLWQQVFFDGSSHLIFAQFPANICCALAAAMLSFYLIERPMLKRRPSSASILRPSLSGLSIP
jgi:peptidoglycan/LPS O-acetylase OafA/YrhL